MDMNIHFQELEHVNNTENQLREMAYYCWLNAGKPNGRDLEFWCDAEREMFGFTVDEYWEEMTAIPPVTSTEKIMFDYKGGKLLSKEFYDHCRRPDVD